MGFFAVYMFFSFAGLGVALFFILRKAFPDVDPMLKVSEYMLYWVLIELFFRYFMQKLPVMDVKPMLVFPVKKSKITHYILAKSGFSGYNFLALFLAVPFSIVLITEGYPALNVLVWLIAVIGIVLTINYTNFIIVNEMKTCIFVRLFLHINFKSN